MLKNVEKIVGIVDLYIFLPGVLTLQKITQSLVLVYILSFYLHAIGLKIQNKCG